MKKKTTLTKMHIAPSTVRYDAVAARDSNEVGQILADMDEVKRALTLLENHSIIQRIEGKFSQSGCKFAILPTVLAAVSSEKLNDVVSVLRKEGDTDEEAEEDPAD